MAAATAWQLYDQTKLALGNKAINLGSDTFKMALFASAGNAGTTALSPGTYVTLTSEVSNANGYTTGGITLTGVVWTNAAGTETFTCNQAQWTASGAGITARFAVIYDSTSGNLIAWTLLDSTPADVSVTAGNTLTIQINGSGIFTLA